MDFFIVFFSICWALTFGSSSLRGTKQSDQESTKNILSLVAEENIKYEKN
jgi:hypothetical protein